MVFLDAFADVPDPRDYTARHDLTELLFVALAAVLCGASNCTEMALFAHARLEILRQFVPLAHGAPSHDTFSRVFRALDPAAFNAAFSRFMAAFGAAARPSGPRHVAVDGKSLRRAYESGRAHMPPLVVTLFESHTFMSLAQTVAQAGGEAQAARAALDLISLKGTTVTADALHCHRAMTGSIRERGGHYALAIKGNQSKLAREVKAALDQAAAAGARVVEEGEHARGRQEIRRALVTPFAQSPGKAALIGLKAVARVETVRSQGGQTRHQTRHFALSQALSPAKVLALVRQHWAIENGLHWHLDVHMAEDQARTRKNNGPLNLAILRRLALNVLRAEPSPIPIRHKQLKARWNDTDLSALMTHMR